MSDTLNPGERTRAGVIYDEEKRAKRVWARAVVIVAYASSQPWSSLGYSVTATEVLTYLLHRSGMPRWLMGQYLRIWDDEIRVNVANVEAARKDPPLKDWIEGLVASMPSFHEAEPKPGQPEFEVV